MGLLAVMVFGFALAFTTAVIDYYQYEEMVTEYGLWAYQNPEHL